MIKNTHTEAQSTERENIAAHSLPRWKSVVLMEELLKISHTAASTQLYPDLWRQPPTGTGFVHGSRHREMSRISDSCESEITEDSAIVHIYVYISLLFNGESCFRASDDIHIHHVNLHGPMFENGDSLCHLPCL